MGDEKEAGVAQSPANSDFETGDRRAAFAGDVGYVPADNREADFFTRNGLNLKSFQRREFDLYAAHSRVDFSRQDHQLTRLLTLGDWGTGTEQLDRSMKSRHLNMIAIGGCIGTGFFVGSGSALTAGGPGSVLICFCIAGVLVFNVVYALGELVVMYPVSGGFYTYSSRFISPAWGTAMGWNYVSPVLSYMCIPIHSDLY